MHLLDGLYRTAYNVVHKSEVTVDRKIVEKRKNHMKRIYKSQKEKMICGVCGGVAEYFNIDPTLIRLLFVIFGLTGSGILAYIVAAVIIPMEP